MSSMQHILHLHIEIFSVTQKSRKQIQILSVHRSITVFIYTLSYQNVQVFSYLCLPPFNLWYAMHTTVEKWEYNTKSMENT